MAQYNLVTLVTVLTLGLFIWMIMRVGKARAIHGVAAPATTGHPEFERHFRVQMNTMEGMLLFLPSLWLFAAYWGELVAAGLGLVWIVGRVIYMLAYVKDPGSRSLGFMIQGGASSLLLIGVLVGAVRMMLGGSA